VRTIRLTPLLLAAVACGGNGPSDPPGLPLTGTFTGGAAVGTPVVNGFVAGRTGATIVKVCGRAGTDFNIAVGNVTASTASNCERLEFDAVAGEGYSVIVTAVAGGGPFNGCWSTALAECSVSPPPGSSSICTEAGYYAPAAGLSGTALRQALAGIVSTNRHLGYLTTPNARDSLYAFVDDPDGDDLITDLYAGRTGFVNSRATAFDAGFSTEHVWPQSRGANIEYAAGTDLNILFTVDTMANRLRSNLPFGVVTQNVQWTSGSGQEESRLGQNAQGQVVFEPRPSKRGDVARAVFYFHTRYYGSGTPGFSLANFNSEEAVLFQWAAADPPDAFEIARNAMVCRAQRNRNPFIDHPEYLAAIGDFPNN
jgi:hypothetical protein